MHSILLYITEVAMAKKSLFGLGTVLAAVTGVVAGALGMFLSDEDNRKKVGKEVRHVEHIVEKDFRAVTRKVGKKTRKTTSKKRTKRRSR